MTRQEYSHRATFLVFNAVDRADWVLLSSHMEVLKKKSLSLHFKIKTLVDERIKSDLIVRGLLYSSN